MLMLLTACSKKNDSVALPQNNSITYSKNIAPIIAEKCTNCHEESMYVHLKLHTYTDVKSIVDNGKLHERVFVKKDMPMGDSLSVYELLMIQSWINNGAKE